MHKVDRVAEEDIGMVYSDVLLFEGITEGDIDTIERAIKRGAGPDSKNEKGETALSVAKKIGNKEIIKLLENAPKPEPNPPLVTAIYMKDASKVREMVEKDPKIINAELNKMTPLMWAISLGRMEMAKLLIELGANVNAVTSDGIQNALRTAFMKGPDEVKFLVDNGADINAVSAELLSEAVHNEKPDKIKILLSLGADINKPYGELKKSLLMDAAMQNSTDMVKFLAENGANINAKANDGNTALILAAWWSNPDTVKLLITLGADIEAKDNNGTTALIQAALMGKLDNVKVLLAAGAKLNKNALEMAKAGMQYEVWEFLNSKL